VPGVLRAGDIRGNLRSGLILKRLSFENESTSVAAGTVHLRLDFDLLPPAVVVQSIQIDRLTITALAGPGTPNEKSIEDHLSALALPVPLDFSNIKIGSLVYQHPDGETAFECNTLSATGRWYKGLRVRASRLLTGPAEWKVRGKISLNPPFVVSAVADSRFEIPAANGLPASNVRINTILRGDLADLDVQAKIVRPAVSAHGKITGLLHEPRWELELSADRLQWPLDDDSPQVILRQVSAQSSGLAKDYQLEADVELEISGLPSVSAIASATGNESGMQIERLRLLGEPVELSASGQMSWTDVPRMDLHAVIDRLKPSQWLARWPADHPLHGALEVGWQNDHVAIRKVNLAVEDDDFSMRGNGEWDVAADKLSADLEWQSLRWPVGTIPADFSSERGRIQVEGKPANWAVAGSFQLQAGQWPNGDLTVNGKGDLESVQLQIERGEALGGEFDGQFSYRWAGRQSWSARASAKDLDISSLKLGLPKHVSGAFSAQGQMEPTEIEIEVERMEGIVHGQRVTAAGGISIAPQKLLARNLLIQSGKSRLQLDGSAQTATGLHFSGRIDALGRFIEGARGQLDASGMLSADPAHPRLDLDVRGIDLAWDSWRIGTIATSKDNGPGDNPATRFELTEVTLGDKLLDTVTLTTSGHDPLEEIQLEARMGDTQLQAGLAGRVSNWGALPESRWSGKIQAMRIENASVGFLNLEQPASLVADAGTLEVGPACFKGPRGGRICARQSWKAGGELNAHARLEAISLNVMQFLLDSDLDFSQTLSGELQWHRAYGEKLRAELRAALSAGQIAFEDDETLVRTGPGLFELRIVDGRLLTGNLEIAIPGAGSINTEFTAPDISMGVDSAIDGRIQIELNHIEPLLSWVPEVDRIAGTINADMRLSGTLAEPRMTGHASLVRGQIDYSPAGLSVTDIMLAGAVYNFNYTEFNGRFASGGGEGELKASIRFNNIFKPEINLEITGHNLDLINVPDMVVKANPDLRLHWYDSLLNLDGYILIPVARISPRYLPSTSASESQDLVITSGELPPGKESFIDRSKLRLNGSVVAELGNDVTVTLEPATARLNGKATFTWDNNLLPVADGNYKISGEVYAYGQLLEVSEGRVSFPNVPADNPHLNVNAEREIYGNVQIKQAGVHITGTLKRPVLEPYTTPVTTRERALTLLVTGHDFDYEQGVGGVEVGMYIAPRLYISYGLGLFETQSVISARYDLKNGFGIKATSGQRETGADISYTIER